MWLGLSCFSCALWNRRLFIIERTFSATHRVVVGATFIWECRMTSRVCGTLTRRPSSTQCPDLTAVCLWPWGTDFGCISLRCLLLQSTCLWWVSAWSWGRTTTSYIRSETPPQKIGTIISFTFVVSLSKLSPCIGLAKKFVRFFPWDVVENKLFGQPSILFDLLAVGVGAPHSFQDLSSPTRGIKPSPPAVKIWI